MNSNFVTENKILIYNAFIRFLNTQCLDTVSLAFRQSNFGTTCTCVIDPSVAQATVTKHLIFNRNALGVLL